MNTRGFALEATLFTMLLISVLIVAAMTGAATVTRTANMDYRNSRVQYAAEAGADAIMAQLADALEDGALDDDELDAVTAPTVEGFTFSEVEVTRIGGVAVEAITDGPFAGLYSLTQRLEIFSEATDPSDNSSGVIVSAKAQAIPIFQFGIFFEDDLEILNGPRLDFDGWTHSNGNIYTSSNDSYFKNIITTPNSVIHNRKDRPESLNGVYINDALGNEVLLTFDSRDTPDPSTFRNNSEYYFDSRLKTSAHGVDTLRVPLPAGMPPITVMQPRQAGDPQLVRKAKFAWKADWYIVVPLNALNGTGSNLCDIITWVRDGGEPTPSNAECEDIFSMEPDRFYDGREDNGVDALDIDLQELFDWVDANPTAETQIMYVTFTGTPADPWTDGTYPAVRIKNGADLRNPFTISTDRPIYVWGDFNNPPGTWYPSAVVGDALTWLSNAWDDDDHDTSGDPKTNASNTEMYTAVLAGHSATPWDWFVSGVAPYGGGVENYPRFLESWGGITATYYGSLVSLHQSVFSTGQWVYGGYYTAPVRDWHFEMRFENPEDLPPGTPVVGQVIHTAFRPVY